MYHISCFVIYSFLGFIFETVLFFILNKKFDSGFLFGPWTIIYGFGFLTVNFAFNYLRNKFNNKYSIYFLLFIFSVIFLTLIEFIGGFLIEKILGIVWWNYEKYFLHIGKYVCIWISLIWAFLALLNIIFVKPFVDGILFKIPKFIFIILFGILIIDFTLSIYLNVLL